MPINDSLLNRLYSSAALNTDDFKLLRKPNNHPYAAIFRQNFFSPDSWRQSILRKLKDRIQFSKGGAFLVSGYRGTGKSTFLNYLLYELEPNDNNPSDQEKGKETIKFISATINLSSFSFENLKYDLINLIAIQLEDMWPEGQDRRSLKSLQEALFFAQSKSDTRKELNRLNITPNLEFLSLKVGGEVEREKVSEAVLVSSLKDNLYYVEKLLKEALKDLSLANKRLIFVLDELDKLPLFTRESEMVRSGDSAVKDEQPRYTDYMDPRNIRSLLEMLSNLKNIFFESGVIFILVVNKNVFDVLKSNSSHEDLLIHLITDAVYIPCYRKNEMRLSTLFPVKVLTSNRHEHKSILENFELCLYYECSGNLRVFFQILAKKIKDKELVITANEAHYLKQKVKIYELNELIYNYVYDDDPSAFSRLYEFFTRIYNWMLSRPENNAAITEESFGWEDGCRWGKIISSYCRGFDNKQDEVTRNLEGFWQEGVAFNNFEALFTILKENDLLDNFPATNYLIRRLTDFSKIIDEKRFLTIERVVRNMDFQEFEFSDTIGRYLIYVLIPLNIAILYNNGVLDIKNNYLQYTYSHTPRLPEYHSGYEYELKGDLRGAFDLYTKYIADNPTDLEAHRKKLTALYYMLKFGFYDPGIDIFLHWGDSVQKMLQNNVLNSRREKPYLSCILFFQYLLNQFQRWEKETNKDNKNKSFEKDNFDVLEKMEMCSADLGARVEPKIWHFFFLYWTRNYFAAFNVLNNVVREQRDPFLFLLNGFILTQIGFYERAWENIRKGMECPGNWFIQTLTLVGLWSLICNLRDNTEAHNFLLHLRGDPCIENFVRNIGRPEKPLLTECRAMADILIFLNKPKDEVQYFIGQQEMIQRKFQGSAKYAQFERIYQHFLARVVGRLG